MTPSFTMLYGFASTEYATRRAAWGWRAGQPPRDLPAEAMQDIIIWSNIVAMAGREAGLEEWKQRGPSYWTGVECDAMAASVTTALYAAAESALSAADRQRVAMLRSLRDWLRYPNLYRKQLDQSRAA